MKRSALQNKRVAVLRMAFRARKVFGTFEKRAPGHNKGGSMPYSLTNSVWVLLCPNGLCEQWSVLRGNLRFIVFIQEDLNV